MARNRRSTPTTDDSTPDEKEHDMTDDSTPTPDADSTPTASTMTTDDAAAAIVAAIGDGGDTAGLSDPDRDVIDAAVRSVHPSARRGLTAAYVTAAMAADTDPALVGLTVAAINDAADAARATGTRSTGPSATDRRDAAVSGTHALVAVLLSGANTGHDPDADPDDVADAWAVMADPVVAALANVLANDVADADPLCAASSAAWDAVPASTRSAIGRMFRPGGAGGRTRAGRTLANVPDDTRVTFTRGDDILGRAIVSDGQIRVTTSTGRGTYDAPSPAAVAVHPDDDASVNGWTAWRDDAGRTLAAIHDAAIG